MQTSAGEADDSSDNGFGVSCSNPVFAFVKLKMKLNNQRSSSRITHSAFNLS